MFTLTMRHMATGRVVADMVKKDISQGVKSSFHNRLEMFLVSAFYIYVNINV